MISSMTGFARRILTTEQGEFQWEARSLNHRAFDISVNLPEPFRQIEADCRRLLAARFNRGKIDVKLSFTKSNGVGITQQVNETAVKELLVHMKQIQGNIPYSSGLSVSEILRWPGVLTSQNPDELQPNEPILKTFDELLDELENDRNREGQEIQNLLSDKIKDLKTLEEKVQRLVIENEEEARSRLARKLEELKTEIDPDRYEQEVTLALLKVDASEEVERLHMHLVELERILMEDNVAGKRLGFILQELVREINTLSSKSAYYPLNALVVDVKVVLEQIREQVNNIA